MTDQPAPVLPPIPDTSTQPLQSPPPVVAPASGTSNADLPVSEVVSLLKNYPPATSSGPTLTEVGTPVVTPDNPITSAPVSTVSTPPPEVSIATPPPTTVAVEPVVAPPVSTQQPPKSPLSEDPDSIKTPGAA